MREGFGYESNAFKLSQLLVPDPVDRGTWEQTIHEWRSSPLSQSLLCWLIMEGIVTERQLMDHLCCALDVEAVSRPEIRKSVAGDPEAELLQKHGYHILDYPSEKTFLIGGKDLCPDLESLVGKQKDRFKWVLVSPVHNRQANPGSKQSTSRESNLRSWLNDLIQNQMLGDTTDLHLERAGNELKVRAHRHNSMQTIGTWTDGRETAVLRMLRTWAGINKTFDDKPCDGAFKFHNGTGTSELRVAFLPTIDGESAVIRTPARLRKNTSLRGLQMPEELKLVVMDSLLHDPGIVAFSGSTGSGKTTTAYAALNELKTHSLKILTIEDPVETLIPHAVQCAVNEISGWSFEAAIRAFMRQDPDVIMVGEIRDRTSALAACRAALTGHAVLTTVHGAREDAVVDRFKAWAIPHGVLRESLRLVVNQRLVQDAKNNRLKAEFSYQRFGRTRS